MQLDLQKAQIQDGILSVIVEKSNFSLFEIGMAHKPLRAWDRLLSAINRATEQRRPLSDMVDVLEGRNGN